ncbi:MAG: SGNH/GDSL hydrolase family protein, partial [Myxococcaceae bacterium]|nr:SGNH/GDSL hydrolase family protein [Myxococcaceae bacterium]
SGGGSAAGGGAAGGGQGGGSSPGGGGLDAGVDGGLPDAGSGTVLYPAGRTQSPLTAEVAAHLRRIVARASTQPKVFSKIGDSNTVNTNYLACFAGSAVTLDSHAALKPTLDFYKAGNAGGTTPYDRVTKAATVGWSASAAIAGNPSPMEQELAAVNPQLATVMFGTNDIQSMNLDAYGRNMAAIADGLLDAGVVPLFTAIPPRDDSTTADAVVPRYNAVARAIAQARGFPFIDLHRELLTLPSHGIGPDGLHLNAAPGPKACQLDAAGLQYGQNRRNLLVLQALDRVHGALTGAAPPDAQATRLQGAGTATDPFRITALPFVHAGDTRRQGANRLSTYPACSAADESGPELYYRLDLASPTNLRVHVVSLGAADLDVHLLGPGLSGSDCLARNDAVVTRPAATGTLYLSVDTYVASSGAKPGEYLLAVLADP